MWVLSPFPTHQSRTFWIYFIYFFFFLHSGFNLPSPLSEVLSSMLYGRAGKDDWSRSSYHTLQSGYSKSPTYECLKIQVCVRMSSHVRTDETAACPTSPIAEHPSALSSPTSSPSSNNSACLFIHCQPLYASCYTPLLFKVLDYKILNVSFSVF